MTRALALALCACGGAASAQCATDVECKGDRICVDGRCAAPDTPAAPIAPLVTTAVVAADHIAEVTALREQLTELHAQYEDAGLGTAMWKFVVASVALSGSAASFAAAMAVGPENGAATLAGSVVAAGVALLFGGIGTLQLGLRLRARNRIPDEIEGRENRLLELGVQP